MGFLVSGSLLTVRRCPFGQFSFFCSSCCLHGGCWDFSGIQQSYQVMTFNPVISQTAWPEAAINCQVLAVSQICVWNRAFINFSLHIIHNFLLASFWCSFCSTNYHWSLETLLKCSTGSFHIEVVKQWGLDVRPAALVSGFLLFQEIVWEPNFLVTQPLSRADVFIPCHGFNSSFGLQEYMNLYTSMNWPLRGSPDVCISFLMSIQWRAGLFSCTIYKKSLDGTFCS